MIAAASLEAPRVGLLYADLQPQLARILSSNVDAPEWLIEEACQMAWSSFLLHGGEIPAGAELGWLSTTSTRVALRLLRRERVISAWRLEPVPGSAPERVQADDGLPDRNLELSELLVEVRRLPKRQARLLLMHGLGYEYEEIAATTGDSCRTVKRQLERARERLRSAVAG